MILLLGGVIGFYLIYLILALIFKHKVGLIVATVLCVIAGICAAVYRRDPQTLLSVMIGAPIVVMAKPIQIRNGRNSDKEDKDDK